MIAITPIPAFSDNYLWLISDQTNAIVVDPGDAGPVQQYLEANNLNLVAILVTHHHADHTGGVATLKQRYDCAVWGPADDPVNHLDHVCHQDDKVTIPQMGLEFSVLSVPGHTLGHIAYFLPQSAIAPNVLFCGDTLFSGGCGRLFEGTAGQMWQSMQKIKQLPQDSLICCAHEYTLSNLKFALKVEPANQHLIDYFKEVAKKRALGIATLPSKLSLELQINPFMRVDQPAVIEAAESHAKKKSMNNAQVFASIRHWKDHF